MQPLRCRIIVLECLLQHDICKLHHNSTLAAGHEHGFAITNSAGNGGNVAAADDDADHGIGNTNLAAELSDCRDDQIVVRHVQSCKQ